jgi:hypothetical protein
MVETPGRSSSRRSRRDVDRLPPRRAWLDGRRPAGACRADLRLDVPLRRPGGPAAVERHPHPDDDVRGRVVPSAARRDRCRSGLARGGLAAARVDAGPVRGAAPAGRLGEDVRPATRTRVGGRGAGALPAHDDRRRARRRVPADRRLARPPGSPMRLAPELAGAASTSGRAPGSSGSASATGG